MVFKSKKSREPAKLHTEDESKSYQGISVAYDFVKSNYDMEIGRGSVLDSKANTSVALSSAAFIALTQFVEFPDGVEYTIQFLKMTVAVAALVASFVSNVLFLFVIQSRKYPTVERKAVTDDDLKNQSEDYIRIKLMLRYNAALDGCKDGKRKIIGIRETNDKRYKYYNWGIGLLFVSVLLYAVNYLMSMI